MTIICYATSIICFVLLTARCLQLIQKCQSLESEVNMYRTRDDLQRHMIIEYENECARLGRAVVKLGKQIPVEFEPEED